MTSTLTFGDCAENHVRMEQIGVRCGKGEGFSLLDVMRARRKFRQAGAICELVVLNSRTCVLVVRGGVDYLLGDSGSDALKAEQDALPKDTKALMWGRVVNKHARHNLCFAPVGHPAAYAEGRGTVISYSDVPLTERLWRSLGDWFGPKAAAATLNGEGNYYYDVTRCGIGYHGDSERRKVIAVRLGATMPLHFQAFQYGRPVGPHTVIQLGHGDVYMMSEEAVGTEWKSSSKVVFRHAAGSPKFTDLPPSSESAD